ncbi:hypothetical protein ACA910_000225 [Epithemia clementina (nom. ined.)]
MTETSIPKKLEAAEQSLADATEQRQQVLEKIKDMQKEVDNLVKRGAKRPREKLSDLDDRLKKLERERTIVSIPLKQEKEILWQMSRVEKLKKQVQEFETFDAEVKEKKAQVSNLREDLKKLGERVSELRTEVSMMKKANQLGCTVEELLGMKVDFPEDKLGMLIGKKGHNMKQLQEKGNVTIDVVRKEGALHIIGSLQSIDATAVTIDRVLAVEEQTIELPKPLVSFITSKGITVISEIRARNPDVDIEVSRTKDCRIKGVPDDILTAKHDLMSVEIVEEELRVTSYETAIVVGKQGATINDLVQRHQAAVEVSRDAGDGATEATIVIRGSVSSVKDAMEEIEDLLAQHKEETHNIPIDPLLKDLLLMNKGAGIQALQKLVNDGCRDILPGNVNVTIEQLTAKIKGKSIVMPKAMEIVSDELRLREASIVRLPIHPAAVPALIGKGGAGIKKIKEGNENVMVEVDRSAGQVVVGSYDKPEEAEKVVKELQAFLNDHKVKAVELNPQLFQAQFRLLLRSSYWKELNELVSVSRDDQLFLLQLRGSEENIEKASVILAKFLEENFQDEITVSANDIGVLLRGGKNSKIEQFAKAHEVRLNTDTGKLVVTATGKKENVEAAKKAINSYLHGGEGVKVVKIVIDDSSVGVIVGKGGSTKAAIETKFPGVSLSVLADQTVAIRGPELEVTNCHKHIVRLLTLPYMTEKEALDEQSLKMSKKSEFRGQLKSIPVQATFEESQVTLRGCRADVYHALALLKNAPGNVYENRVFLELSCFRTFDNASRGAHLARIQSATRTKISVDATTSSIILAGKKENVIAAKTQLFQFLEFLLASKFARESLPGRAQQLVGQPTQLGNLAEGSGAFMYVDRDIGCLVITSADSSSVKKAQELVREKFSSLDSTIYKLDLGVDAEWLVPKLIGKSGARIKALRKSLECSVEVDDSSVTLVSLDPEKLEKAKAALDAVVAEERSQCVVVELTEENMAAFLGHKGSLVKEFEKQHDVKAQATRKPRGQLRITGEAGAVAKAKDALEEWLRKRESPEASDNVVIFNFESAEGFLLRRLIGKNGNRINALRTRCMCQIEIDVEKRTLKISSEDEEKREAAKKIVEDLLEEERGQNVVLHLSQSDMPAFIGPKGSNVREFEKTHGVRVQVLKTDGGGLHINGDSDAVVKATSALEEWKARGTNSSSSNEASSSDGSSEGDEAPTISAPPDSNNGSSEPMVDAPRKNTKVYQMSGTHKPMKAPQKTDFPELSAPLKKEDAGANGKKVPPETSKPMHSWASIVQNPSKESTTCSSLEESSVANVGDGEVSVATLGSETPLIEETPVNE